MGNTTTSLPALPAWVEWAESITVILGVIIAIITLIIYLKEYIRHNREYAESNKRLRAESAVRMAEMLAKEIVSDFCTLDCKWKVTERCSKLVEIISQKRSLNFDFAEVDELPADVTASVDLFFAENKENEEFRTLVLGLLNKLEFISMNFVYNIAQADLVYQSMHQSFILFMQTFYLAIASLNKGIHTGPGKFYTCSIELYNRWNAKRCDKIDSYNAELKKKQEAEAVARRTGVTVGEPLK